MQYIDNANANTNTNATAPPAYIKERNQRAFAALLCSGLVWLGFAGSSAARIHGYLQTSARCVVADIDIPDSRQGAGSRGRAGVGFAVLVLVLAVAVGANRKCREQWQVVLLRFEGGHGWGGSVAGSALDAEGGSRLS
jgi:hypothetical protein